MLRPRHGRRRSRGQSLVEFALILPVFLLLVAGMTDFGMGLYSYMTVINAARDGARVGSLACGTASPACSPVVTSRVASAASGMTLTTTTVCTKPDNTVTSCDSGLAKGGGTITVTVGFTYRMIWPLAFGSTIPMASSAKFMVQ